ncbi:MAG: NAD(P)/FAD-dependent oxidoreductase [Pikeienuella sp.]
MKLYPDHVYAPTPAPSYWQATTPDAVPGPALAEDLMVDTAVIGGGYTGLNAALRLAQRGVDVAVFDTGHPGWGASGRNGGFVCVGGSAHGYDHLIAKHGQAETQNFVNHQRAAIEHVAALLEAHAINADRHSDGEWALAHSRSAFEGAARKLATERALGFDVRAFSQEELNERGMGGPSFHGGHQLACGFAIHPLKYATGLARATQAAGAQVFSHSKVTRISSENGYRLTVNGHTVQARRVIIGANGYAQEGLVPWLNGRFLPVVSSIMVTEEISEADQRAQGWWSDQAAYDSRALVHYFRMLPEGRMMFGARGGSSLSKRGDRYLETMIRREFETMFPGWRHIATSHRWTGLLSLARDRSLYTGPIPDMPGAFTSFAYHGNGVAMGSYCGKLLADMALGDLAPGDLPLPMRAPARKFPAAALRMAYIKAVYAWWDVKEALGGTGPKG